MTKAGVFGIVAVLAVGGGVFAAMRARDEAELRRVAETFRTDAERELARHRAAADRTPPAVPSKAESGASPSSESQTPDTAGEIRRLREEVAALQRALDAARTPAVEGGRPTTRVAEAPPPGGLDAFVARARADLARALGADDSAKGLAALASGEVWAPFVRPRTGDPGAAGVRALVLYASLRSVGSAEFAAAVRSCGRTDPEFTDAAGRAWADLLRREAGDLRGTLLKASSDAEPLGLRLTALAAALEADMPDAGAWCAAAATRSAEERAYSLRALPAAGASARGALAALARSARMPSEFAHEAIRALASGATKDEAPELARLAMETPGAALALEGVAWSPEARPFVVAAFAERMFEDSAALRFTTAAVGAVPGAAARDVAARVFADRTFVAALAAVARDRRRDESPPSDAPLALRPSDAPELADALEASGPFERARIAEKLAAIGHSVGVAALRALMADEAADVRGAAVAAAGRAGATELADLAAALAGDSIDDVRFHAAGAIERLGAPIDPALGVPVLAGARLGVSEPVVAGILRHEDRRRSLSLLIEAFDAELVDEPTAAADAVASLALERGFDVAAGLATHPSPPLRAAVLRALSSRPTEGRVRALGILDRGAEDPSYLVRIAAADGLGRIRDDLARARLVQLTADPSTFVREAALRGLAGQDPKPAVPAVRRALGDADPDVCVAARIALLRLGVEDDLPALVVALRDPWFMGLALAAFKERFPFVDGPADAERIAAERTDASRPR